MTIFIQQNIFRLQISVNDTSWMKISNSINNLSRVYLCSSFVESLFFSQICEELTTIQEINDEIQFSFCLESVMKTHDIWIFNFLKNISFGYIQYILFKIKLKHLP